MSRTARIGLSGVLGLGLLVSLAVVLTLILFPSSGKSIASPPAGNFTRLASAFSVEESYTTSEQTLWTKTLTFPGSYKTLYVTVMGQSDDHDEAVQSLGCQVDGNDCDPDRWIKILNVGDNDWHDNSVSARWCVKLPPSFNFVTHNVKIDQASDNGGYVYIENVVITVDADTLANGCTEFASVNNTGDAPTSGAPHHR